MSFLIHNAQDMIELWLKFSQEYPKILLHGELGAGKTTLTKWFAQWLDIHPDQVQSPTYTYFNIYQDKLVHADLYRLERPEQLIQLGIQESLISYPYLIIERPKFVHQYIDSDYINVTIRKLSGDTREVLIS
jgi:tRNA threonylcarbamoyladenosine biosynthesis protein TsaE